MEKCYSYQTSLGSFSIVFRQGVYHAVYGGISVLSFCRAEEVAAVLGYGYKFSLIGSQCGEIDTANLRIPTDLSDWTRCYFTPSDIKGAFRANKNLANEIS